MQNDTDQEKNHQFKHITVGGGHTDDALQLEEEEVVAIGAVDVITSDVVFDDDASEGDTRSEATENPLQVQKPSGSENATDMMPEESIDEDDLGGPMPLQQKIVLICCAIGLVIVIVFLIWFWLTQR